MSVNDELVVPDAAKEDPKSFELIRIWIANKGQPVALRNVWKDPASWGLMLCDLARHVANAYQQEEGAIRVRRFSESRRGLMQSLYRR